MFYINPDGKCDICGKEPILVKSFKLLFGRTFSSLSVYGYNDDHPILNQEIFICIECRTRENSILKKLIKILKSKLL